MKTHLLAFGVALAATCFPASAQWAVVDIDAVAQLTRQVQQGAQQIQVATNMYGQMQAMAKRMYNLRRYRGPQNVFEAIKYADQYATLADWAVGENTGDANSIDNGYAATTVLAQGNDFLRSINGGLASSARAMYSTQEIMDGHNLAAMRAAGQIRSAAAQYKSAIDQLESDSGDESDAAQAQLAVEQRTSNAAVLQLRQTQDLTALAAAQLDQQVAQTKLTRDQLSENANWTIQRQQSFDTHDSLYSGAADSWMKWRLSTVH